MTTQRSRQGGGRQATLATALGALAKRMSGCRSLRPGAIVLRLGDGGEATFVLVASGGAVKVEQRASLGEAPLIEIIGEARRVSSILAGRADARTQFLAGGFRIRGDLRYFSDLALELGILKEPL
jgi:hypothetical protein